MNRTRLLGIAATAGVCAALTITTSPAAHAESVTWPQPGSQPADTILSQIQGMGYRVGINWVNNGVGVPLSRCTVSGYHAPGRTDDPATATVYVDVVCPDED